MYFPICKKYIPTLKSSSLWGEMADIDNFEDLIAQELPPKSSAALLASMPSSKNAHRTATDDKALFLYAINRKAEVTRIILWQ
jgi:hypothetical protein